MTKKRSVAILLAVLLAVALAACAPSEPSAQPTPSAGTQTGGQPADSPDAKPDGEAQGGQTSEYAETFNYSLCVLDAEKHGGTAKNDFFNKKFNVTWEYIPVSWGDWKEKVRTWVATDDMPDLLRWDMKYSDAVEYKSWAQQGAFKAIPNLEVMKERWPNLAAIREKTRSDDLMATVDGELYGWLPARNQPEYMNNSNYIIIGYRRDWAKEVGMYKENDIYTWDEIKAMIDAINQQDPGGNGVGNTLGIVAETWSFPVSFMLTTGTPGYYKGYYVDKETNKWTHIMLSPGYRDSIIFFNKLYQDGYFWKDQIVAGGTEGQDYFRSGRTGFFMSNWTPGGLGGHLDAMLESGVIDDPADVGLTTIYSDLVPGTYWYNGIEDYYIMWNFNHNMDDAHQERVLDMWQWLDTEEGFNFRNYGLEGTDYTVGDDGSINMLWPKDEMGNFISPYKDSSFTEQSSPQLDNEFQHYATSRQDVLTEFDRIGNVLATVPGFNVARVHDIGMYFDGEQYLTYGDFDSDLKSAGMEIIATSKDPGADFDAFVQKTLPKLQLVLDELEAKAPKE